MIKRGCDLGKNVGNLEQVLINILKDHFWYWQPDHFRRPWFWHRRYLGVRVCRSVKSS